jgi:hypothetical protein
VIRQVIDTDASSTGATQSTQTHTDVSFDYTPGSTAGPGLPSEDACDPTGHFTAPCRILPILNLDYHLATNDLNTGRPGPQLLHLTVDHLSYDNVGSTAAITSVAVSVSFDGGTTWQPAVVLGAHGQYTAAWSNPASAAGTSPDLKVTATDAAGGSITQIVTSAYTIAGPAN